MNYASLKLHRAVERARWLAELAAALDAAEKLALSLCERRGVGIEALAIRQHLLTLRREVDSLQKGRLPPPGEIDPNWI